MGRIRSIKPDMAKCRPFAKLSSDARVSFLLLLTALDDHGYGEDDPQVLKAELHPLDDMTAAQMDTRLGEMAAAGDLLCRYQMDGLRLLHVPRFLDADVPGTHKAAWGQRPQKPTPSRYPPCPHDHTGNGQQALFGVADSGRATGIALRSNGSGSPTINVSPLQERVVVAGSGERVVAHARMTPPQLAAAFDAFWAVYPNKAGKKAAMAAFGKAVTRASLGAILDGATRYRDDPNRDPAYTKHASTWLNQDCWDDPPLPRRGGNRAAQHDAEMMTAAQQAAAMRSAERSTGR